LAPGVAARQKANGPCGKRVRDAQEANASGSTSIEL